jgi:hypothetical protein
VFGNSVSFSLQYRIQYYLVFDFLFNTTKKSSSVTFSLLDRSCARICACHASKANSSHAPVASTVVRLGHRRCLIDTEDLFTYSVVSTSTLPVALASLASLVVWCFIILASLEVLERQKKRLAIDDARDKNVIFHYQQTKTCFSRHTPLNSSKEQVIQSKWHTTIPLLLTPQKR